ncbi:MAG: cytochrome-c peroxidase [Rhodobacterales bacterium]|nr:MAG: cytochrome-c peroxidase [Rhodobacterales bacterium]
MHKWVTVGILSLQATLSLAADLPEPVTHSDFPTLQSTPFSTVMLGRDLFFDPILSGNRNIACATCHHSALGSADALPLAVGEGGAGLGTARHGTAAAPAPAHIPRNAPALFNAGATEFTTMFHDGRVTRDPSQRFGFVMPEGRALERPVPNALAAQAMLPILSPEEMAGQPGENAVADAVAAEQIRGPHGAWQILASRVEDIPAYRRRFDRIIGADEPIHITDIATAIAAFIAYEFRATDSPFDQFLKGRKGALTPPQKRGMELFYGQAGCSACHSGPFQTDHGFHAIAMPQLGPGKHHDGYGTDHGRAGVTYDDADMYAFRTPSLRNIALTAPYGHSGAYATLEGIVRHHLDPLAALARFDAGGVSLPSLNAEGTVPASGASAAETARIAAANTLAPTPLNDQQVAEIIAFLHALTDPGSITGRLGAPLRVPSGLPMDKLSLH